MTRPMEELRTGGKLIIVCGLPGSGKTTYARELEEKLHAVRFCPDEWMATLSLDLWDDSRRADIERLQWEFGQQLLAYGLSIIIEWGTWGRSERDELRLRARELGASVELHYLPASVDLLVERVKRRCMEHPAITREQLVHWAEIFQAPATEEMALFDCALTVKK